MIRFPSTTLRKGGLRCCYSIKGRSLLCQWQPIFRLEHQRTIHLEPENDATETHKQPRSSEKEARLIEWEAIFKKSSDTKLIVSSPSNKYKDGEEVTVHGFLKKRKQLNPRLTFCEIENKLPDLPVQIVSSWDEEGSAEHAAHQAFSDIPAYSPIIATGILQASEGASSDPLLAGLPRWSLKLASIRCLNPFPKDIIVSKDAVWPPQSRHLQLRFDPLLRDRLRFRDNVRDVITSFLRKRDFIQVETPLLFKSTPEGAREFLVPTRRQGYAYALPQSPQQYKQILMAGGISRYYQFAKCFRDEDHRADRQPEFTQLDLEMAFASAGSIRSLVAAMVINVLKELRRFCVLKVFNGIRHPVWTEGHLDKRYDERNDDNIYPDPPGRIPKMAYHDAMAKFGTDKPDLRIQMPYVSDIVRFGLPEEFTKKITSLERPIVQACKFRFGLQPSHARKFIKEFMDNLPYSTVKLSPESTPAVFIYDSSKPLNGLSTLGHEYAKKAESMPNKIWPKCEDGDIIIMHARQDKSFSGGSTDLGRLRTAIHAAAVQQGLIPKDNSLKLVWITDFPLFTPNGDDPGQGGASGFSSTHHPFTAPTIDCPRDVKLLAMDPLKLTGKNYDLVINGVEVGGGSQRIHQAEVQEAIMRDVLKMPENRIADFSHLLEALRAGCPPHAGFALGFDRFISVLADVPSVRDVIAFPKTNKGEDLLVGSPTKITREQQTTYHIFVEEEK